MIEEKAGSANVDDGCNTTTDEVNVHTIMIVDDAEDPEEIHVHTTHMDSTMLGTKAFTIVEIPAGVGS